MEMYQKGDQVRVTLDGESVIATVVFASADGRNLLLDAGRWFCGSPMPVIWCDAEGKLSRSAVRKSGSTAWRCRSVTGGRWGKTSWRRLWSKNSLFNIP